MFLGLFFFLSLKFSRKKPKIRKWKGQKKRGKFKDKNPKKTERLKKLWKTDRQKKTLGGVLIRCFGSTLWFGSFLLVSFFDAVGRCRFQRRALTLRSGPSLWCRGLVLCFRLFFWGRRPVPRLGPVLRCRGPLSWSGTVVLASSWCRRSVSRPGPVLWRHGPASWFGSLSWCCSAILWFPGVVVGVVVV